MDLSNLDPQNLQQYLQGVSWPASKEDIVGAAQGNNASGGIVEQLQNNLPGGQYSGPQEVVSYLQG